MAAWLKLLPSIINFCINTLPQLVEYWIKSSKERDYRERIKEIDARVAQYKKTKDLDDLNELAK